MKPEEQIQAADEVRDLLLSDGIVNEDLGTIDILDAMACVGVMFKKGTGASDAYMRMIAPDKFTSGN